MQRKKAALTEEQLAACNRVHNHPTAMAITRAFGHRGNNYANALRQCMAAMVRFAWRNGRDGWLTRREALRLCALDGAAPATRRGRLKDLLSLTDHYGEDANGRIALKKMFLTEARRRFALGCFRQKREQEALKKRRQRGSSLTGPVRAYRKKAVSPPSKSHSAGGAQMSPQALESIKAIISISEPAQEAPAPAQAAKLPPMPAPDAPMAERRAWLAAMAAAETPEPAAREPVRKPRPKPIARDENGVPLCFYSLGFVYFEGVWKRYTEDQWWKGYRKVKAGQRLGKQRGAAITYATRQIASGAWQPAI